MVSAPDQAMGIDHDSPTDSESAASAMGPEARDALLRRRYGYLPRDPDRREVLAALLRDSGSYPDELFEALARLAERGVRLRHRRRLALTGEGGLAVWGHFDHAVWLGHRKLCTWRTHIQGEAQQFGTGLWLHETGPEPEPPLEPCNMCHPNVDDAAREWRAAPRSGFSSRC